MLDLIRFFWDNHRPFGTAGLLYGFFRGSLTGQVSEFSFGITIAQVLYSDFLSSFLYY
jgi:hypothetical protein